METVCGQSYLQVLKPPFILACLLQWVPHLDDRALPPSTSVSQLTEPGSELSTQRSLALDCETVSPPPPGRGRGLTIRVSSEWISDTTPRCWVLAGKVGEESDHLLLRNCCELDSRSQQANARADSTSGCPGAKLYRAWGGAGSCGHDVKMPGSL